MEAGVTRHQPLSLLSDLFSGRMAASLITDPDFCRPDLVFPGEAGAEWPVNPPRRCHTGLEGHSTITATPVADLATPSVCMFKSTDGPRQLPVAARFVTAAAMNCPLPGVNTPTPGLC